MKIELSQDQSKAVEAIIEFVKSKKTLFTMGGYAGTGKPLQSQVRSLF